MALGGPAVWVARASSSLDGQHVSVADVGQRVQQLGPVLCAELAADLLLEHLQADRAEGVVLPLGFLLVGADPDQADKRHGGSAFRSSNAVRELDEPHWKTNGKMNAIAGWAVALARSRPPFVKRSLDEHPDRPGDVLSLQRAEAGSATAAGPDLHVGRDDVPATYTLWLTL